MQTSGAKPHRNVCVVSYLVAVPVPKRAPKSPFTATRSSGHARTRERGCTRNQNHRERCRIPQRGLAMNSHFSTAQKRVRGEVRQVAPIPCDSEVWIQISTQSSLVL